MHSREECTVPLNNGCFTPVVFSAYGALPVDGSVWSSFADVEGVTSKTVGHQLRVPSYGSLQDKMIGRLDWLLWREVCSTVESSKEASCKGSSGTEGVKLKLSNSGGVTSGSGIGGDITAGRSFLLKYTDLLCFNVLIFFDKQQEKQQHQKQFSFKYTDLLCFNRNVLTSFW